VRFWTLPPAGADPWHPWRRQEWCEDCDPACGGCLAALGRGELVIVVRDGRRLCLAHAALRAGPVTRQA
jgi:hypothetical protein